MSHKNFTVKWSNLARLKIFTEELFVDKKIMINPLINESHEDNGKNNDPLSEDVSDCQERNTDKPVIADREKLLEPFRQSGINASESTQKSPYNSLDIAVSSAIPASVLKQLEEGKRVELANDVHVSYGKDGNEYWFYAGKDENTESLALQLSDDQKKIIQIKSAYSIQPLLTKITAAGGLSESFMTKLGLSAGATEKMMKDEQKNQEENANLLARLQTGDLAKLPDSAHYKGSKASTETVPQGDAVILNTTNKNLNGLYSFGAGPCSILVLTNGRQAGAPEKIALAHIDQKVNEQDIIKLIRRMGPLSMTRATIISGHREIATTVGRALQQCEKSGVKIDFANVDLDGDRSDAVIVDRQGIVHYGERPELSSLDPKELEVIKMNRDMARLPGEEGLYIKYR